MSHTMDCDCGPPTFGRTESWQMCGNCLTAGCRFGVPCRTGRPRVHPVPAWSARAVLHPGSNLRDAECRKWVTRNLPTVTARVNEEFGAELPAGTRLTWADDAGVFELDQDTTAAGT